MIYIISLLSVTRKTFGYRIFIFGITAGIANAFLISVINETIKRGVQNRTPSLVLILGYVGALLLYFCLQYFYQALLIRSSEVIIMKYRKQLIDRIRRSSLQSYERVGNTKLFVLIAHDTNVIGQIAALSSSIIISFVVIIGSLLYLLALSYKGFLVTVFILSISLVISFSKQNFNIRRIKYGLDLQNAFFSYLRHLLDGIKEVKMDSKLNKGLYDTHVEPSMEDVARDKIDTNIFQARFSLLGPFIFFMIVGIILYVFPFLKVSITENPSQFVIVLLYILSPLQVLIQLIPTFSRVKATTERLESIQEMLAMEEPAEHQENGFCNKFEKISLKEIMYHYKYNEETIEFRLGPIDLDIYAGDLIFILGGNGTGKSTFIKVLTGLYMAEKGSIHLNNITIDNNNLQDYRDLFGVIFSDNHLFDYLYGLEKISDDTVMELIQKTGLSEKVEFRKNKFTTIDLSEGQKKRIALISLLLKNKPVYILDEWAANQDPSFKHFFYNTLIPELNSQNKTVIIITHDDRYLHMAKRIFKMENGLLYECPVNSYEEDSKEG